MEGVKYKHYKGNVYTVTGVAMHTETGEVLVIYKGANGKVWARPHSMFYGYTDDDVRRFVEIK